MRGPALAALAAALLAGCAENLDRRDTISGSAGDAQAQAIAAQAVNPWPSAAYDKTWTSEGWILLRRPGAVDPAAPEGNP